RMKLDVLLGLALVPDPDVDTEHARHRCGDVVDTDRRARGEIDRRVGATGLHQPQHAVHGIVDVHEVDEIRSVAARDELARAAGEGEEPSRGDLARWLVRHVSAEEADVDVAAWYVPAFGEEANVVLGGELRNRVWKSGCNRRRR